MKKVLSFLKLYFIYTKNSMLLSILFEYCVYNILVIDTEPEYKSFGTSRISMSDVLMKR